MPPLLNIVALASFASALSTRALDPVLPHIAQDFGISIGTAAGLSAVFALTFAIVQPVMGAVADLFGKARLLIVCLILLGLFNMLGALTSSYAMMMATRILAGIGSGGCFPIAMSLTGDLVTPEKRQLGLSRVLAGNMTGNLLGASLAGGIGDLVGWRGVLVLLGATAIIAGLALAAGFRQTTIQSPGKVDLTAIAKGYRTIFSNPNAPICFGAVFVEGCCVFGLFPYIASFLFALGETRLSIAGLVIAGFAVGGLAYTMTVGRLLPLLGMKAMMIVGGLVLASQIFALGLGPPWQAQILTLVLMGLGFYMMHGCIQVYVTELTVEARATAMALHSFFFFLGQTAGPIAYGFGIAHASKLTTLATAALGCAALGVVCAKLLVPRPPADAV